MNWLMLVTALLPGVFIRQAVIQIRFIRKLRRVGIEAEATVISQREAPAGRGQKKIVPRVAYRTTSGEKLVGESCHQDGDAEFFDGDIALIVYDPDKPTDFLLYQELRLGQRYAILGAASLMLVVTVWAALRPAD